MTLLPGNFHKLDYGVFLQKSFVFYSVIYYILL